jgi:hypothetical protein
MPFQKIAPARGGRDPKERAGCEALIFGLNAYATNQPAVRFSLGH